MRSFRRRTAFACLNCLGIKRGWKRQGPHDYRLDPAVIEAEALLDLVKMQNEEIVHLPRESDEPRLT